MGGFGCSQGDLDVVFSAIREIRDEIAGMGLSIHLQGVDSLMHVVRVMDLDVVSGVAELARQPKTGPFRRNGGIHQQAIGLWPDAKDPVGGHPVQPLGGTRVPRPAAAALILGERPIYIAGRDVRFRFVGVNIHTPVGRADFAVGFISPFGLIHQGVGPH